MLITCYNMGMLDDLKFLSEKDPSSTLEIALKEWTQLQYNFNYKSSLDSSKIKNIVFAGMGGSALSALISKSYPGYKIPFEVVRDYLIPDYVNEQTLFIASSYSGNTEETVSALDFALQKKAQIIVLCSGGVLQKIAKEKNLDLILIPKGLQPRYTVFYGLRAILEILVELKLCEAEKLEQFVNASDFIKDSAKQWASEVRTTSNLAKQIAQETSGKSIVIYGGNLFAQVAYKWKISFNENAKQVAWWNQFSEFNHNEFIGWTKQPVIKPYCVIEIISDKEHPRILKRFELSNKLLSGNMPHPIIVKPKGSNLIEEILYAINLGDFVSLYSAILNGVNPEPVELIEKFKRELAK